MVALAMLFFTLDRYHPFDPRWLRAALFYGALPLLSILIFFKARFREFGLRIGDWRVWGLHVLVTVIMLT